ncbi:MAG TPA: hypothetical protein VFK06_24620 [Candidatus Angelobacter sp.]|nr:hypothetical protein [Candidatus Angelobacter sp.]
MMMYLIVVLTLAAIFGLHLPLFLVVCVAAAFQLATAYIFTRESEVSRGLLLRAIYTYVLTNGAYWVNLLLSGEGSGTSYAVFRFLVIASNCGELVFASVLGIMGPLHGETSPAAAQRGVSQVDQLAASAAATFFSNDERNRQ